MGAHIVTAEASVRRVDIPPGFANEKRVSGDARRASMLRQRPPRAERDGTVKTVFTKPGDSLAVDAVILEFA